MCMCGVVYEQISMRPYLVSHRPDIADAIALIWPLNPTFNLHFLIFYNEILVDTAHS